ncbi:MAG: hypothetical protein HGA54_03620 [Actinobacteria bacterium]|nr:hypothetical protein [Actinomycetota bacterium]
MFSRKRIILGTFIKHALRAFVRSRFGFVKVAECRRIRAFELRCAFEYLGPTFIKIGQLVSIRPDVFPQEYILEMESLRDRVDPLDFEQIRPVIMCELGSVSHEYFESFDTTPFASASIAQVYRAKLAKPYRSVSGDILPAGCELAVKIVRPATLELIEGDIETIRPFIEKLSRIEAISRYNLSGFLSEFESSLRSECDLRIEAHAAEEFLHAFRDDPLVTAPSVIWPLTSRSILTMEYQDGWTLDRADEAVVAGVDVKSLSIHGAEIFMRQVLMVGRFHADLHPSNLMVLRDGRISYLDFGILGTVPPEQRSAIAQVLLATVYRDAQRAITYSGELGLVFPVDRVSAIEDKVAGLMEETISGRRRDIRAFALGFLGILQDEKVEIPHGFGLLIKGLITVEGCARLLYSDIDVIEVAREYATTLVAAQLITPERIVERLPDAIRAAIAEILR